MTKKRVTKKRVTPEKVGLRKAKSPAKQTARRTVAAPIGALTMSFGGPKAALTEFIDTWTHVSLPSKAAEALGKMNTAMRLVLEAQALADEVVGGMNGIFVPPE
jgi:hypothetical protein